MRARGMCRGAGTVLAVVAVLAGSPARSRAESVVPAPLERLAALGRLWGAVRFNHPWLGYRNLDWDRAAVEAVPRVLAASTAGEYAAALGGMLAVLGDTATRVERTAGAEARPSPSAPAPAPPTEAAAPFAWAAPGILHVRAGDIFARGSTGEASTAGKAVAAALTSARGLILDLRAARDARELGEEMEVVLPFLFFGPLQRTLVDQPLPLPSWRTLIHSGWRADGGYGGLDYQPQFITLPSTVVIPIPGRRAPPVVIVAGSNSHLPLLAVGLLGSGAARLVTEGPLDDSSLVKTLRVPVGGELEAVVRTADLLNEGRAVTLRADRQVAPTPHGQRDAALAVALKMVRVVAPGRMAQASGARLPAAPIWRPAPGYPEMRFPDLPHRLLAVFRFWNVVRYLDPHLSQAVDWDAALPRYLHRMEEAADARAYALAVAAMAGDLHDGHAEISGSPELADFFGRASPPVSVRPLEGQVVVTALGDPSARQAGLAVGDVILRVDGEAIADRIARLTPYIPASTTAHRLLRAAARALRGPEGSTALLTVSDGRGEVKEVRLSRSSSPPAPAATPAAFRLLEGNVGYADLTRLEGSQVDPMFEAFRQTRAIVFDMRGYPRGTAWAIAPRINVRGAHHGALYERRQTGGPSETTVLRFHDDLPPTPAGKWIYRGRTVMLIDERAVSQSEHSGLYFREAAGTIFVGSHTAGADGERTDVILPGGLLVGFTGSEVRHVNGERLQGVGLVPDIEVKPTIAGVRAGRDEVLERALAFLRTGQASGATPAGTAAGR